MFFNLGIVHIPLAKTSVASWVAPVTSAVSDPEADGRGLETTLKG